MNELSDDTLVVFVSDSHIGGDEGRDIFESPEHLARLFDDIGAHPGPVELVLAGDFFDFLRMPHPVESSSRAAITMARPEYQAMFAALRRFAAGKGHRVVYLPGNHDAEVWWNETIRDDIKRQGIVHSFALSYGARFASLPGRVIYCEHGNEFDPENAIRDYNDPLDTPLGDHIVTEIIPRLPGGWMAEALQLKEIERVFPLGVIPEWVAGRLFYALVTQAFIWLLLPLLVAYVGFEMISFAMGEGVRAINALFVKIAYDILLLVAVFSVFFLLARRIANRAIRAAPRRVPESEQIRGRLEKGIAPPLAGDLGGDIAVFVSGHTHAPDLVEFAGAASGRRGVIVNSGCWLRQLQSLRTYFGTPKVYLSRFVQTHVRVYLSDGALKVELWEHPRPSRPQLRVVERIAVLNWLPVQPEEAAAPRVRASAVVG